VRRNVFGGHHVLGDFLAHDAERLHFVTAEIDALAGHADLQRRNELAAMNGGRTGCSG
jgi:hypothetical protein